jgi:hypothetical protein
MGLLDSAGADGVLIRGSSATTPAKTFPRCSAESRQRQRVHPIAPSEGVVFFGADLPGVRDPKSVHEVPCIRLLKARVADACGLAPEHLTEPDHSLQVRLLGSGGRADLFERMDRAV